MPVEAVLGLLSLHLKNRHSWLASTAVIRKQEQASKHRLKRGREMPGISSRICRTSSDRTWKDFPLPFLLKNSNEEATEVFLKEDASIILMILPWYFPPEKFVISRIVRIFVLHEEILCIRAGQESLTFFIWRAFLMILFLEIRKSPIFSLLKHNR